MYMDGPMGTDTKCVELCLMSISTTEYPLEYSIPEKGLKTSCSECLIQQMLANNCPWLSHCFPMNKGVMMASMKAMHI